MNKWHAFGFVTGGLTAAIVGLALWRPVLTAVVRNAIREEMAKKQPTMSSPPGRAGVERENEVLAFRPLSEDAVEVTVRLNGGVTNMVFRKAP